MAKTLSIRGVNEHVAQAFAGGAAVRGWTQAEYLRQLMYLHSLVRLEFSDGRWQWKGPESVTGQDDEARWSISAQSSEDFVDELGKHLAKSHMLSVTA